MKRTHRTFALTVAGLAVGALALVSIGPGVASARGPSVDRMIERLTDRLDLTEEQVPQVREVLQSSRTKREAIFDEAREYRQAMRERLEALMDETHDSLGSVLTGEQLQELDDMREEHGERRRSCWEDRAADDRGHHRGRGPMGGFEGRMPCWE